MKHVAIIGPTASGKTSLALQLAERQRGVILSLDSLALYRRIDIASAKPTQIERGMVPHFGIDLIEPDQPFDVTRFIESYREAEAFAHQHHRPLVIVGGSGFYLKILLEGISPLPPVSEQTHHQVSAELLDLKKAYRHLSEIDPPFVRSIDSSDRYRIEKGLTIYYATQRAPSHWFATHPPVPFIEEALPIYEIVVGRTDLRDRISLRTDQMLNRGLIDEVCSLERRYTRYPNAMKSIGIKEVLAYLDGEYTYGQMREKIITNTARLAKRQVTFNKSQFEDTRQGSLQELEKMLLS